MSNETASQQANATPPPPPELRLDDPSFQVSLQCIQDTVQHQFARPSLVREALVGERSPVLIGGEAIPQDNQKMAMLGDTILKSAYMDTVTRRNELLCGNYPNLHLPPSFTCSMVCFSILNVVCRCHQQAMRSHRQQ